MVRSDGFYLFQVRWFSSVIVFKTQADNSVESNRDPSQCPFAKHLLFQGAYFGVFTGAALTTWVFIGSVLYPPNKYPGLRSVRECDFYKNTTETAKLLNGTYDNATAKVFADWGDGIIRNPFKGHR